MICPKCRSESVRVMESRDADQGMTIRRRRTCDDCQFRFTTYERMVLPDFMITKKDGTHELYNRDKLLHGIRIACAKRPVTPEAIEVLLSELEGQWVLKGSDLTTKKIGEDIMHALREMDLVAYVRFASVYHDFADLEAFSKILQSLPQNS